MTRFTNAMLIGSLAAIVGLTACGGGGEEAAVESEAASDEIAPPSPEALAAAQALTSRLSGSEIQLVPTQRGQAEIGYTQPRARRDSDFIVTSFRIRNQAQNAIAGFTVNEFWFDADGNTVTGANVRFREPILTGEVREIELRVPRHPAMDRSNYEFSHQNGDISATLVDELPDPVVEEEEEPGEPEDAAQ